MLNKKKRSLLLVEYAISITLSFTLFLCLFLRLQEVLIYFLANSSYLQWNLILTFIRDLVLWCVSFYVSPHSLIAEMTIINIGSDNLKSECFFFFWHRGHLLFLGLPEFIPASLVNNPLVSLGVSVYRSSFFGSPSLWAHMWPKAGQLEGHIAWWVVNYMLGSNFALLLTNSNLEQVT